MKFEKFTVKSREAIADAQRMAGKLGNPEIRPGHLLGALLTQEDGVAPKVIEKVGIEVEDAPFVAVDFEVSGEDLTFETHVGDFVTAGPEHPIRVVRDSETGEPSPYVLVRANLEALIDRKSFYRLVDIGEEADVDGVAWFGVQSKGAFFPIIPAAELDG